METPEADIDENGVEEQQAEVVAETDNISGDANEDSHENEEAGHEQDEENEDKSGARAVDDSDDEEFAGFGEEDINAEKSEAAAKKRSILSSDDEEADEDEAGEKSGGDDNEEDDDGVVEGINKKKKKKHKRDHHRHHHKKSSHHKSSKHHHHKKHRSDGDGNEDEEVDPEKIEEEQDDDHIEPGQPKASTDDENEASGNEGDGKKKKEISDLDMVLNKQKEENRRKNRRKKVDSEEINDMDNLISNFITEMKNVANEDRVANEKSQTAVRKLKLLPEVINLLQKSDYQATMIELGILGAIAEWLAPLPDRSLPNIKIREAFIEALRDVIINYKFGEINVDYLKSSGIGKAVMFLYKHSKETKQNKQKLEKIIHNWSRPIFNLDAGFKQLTKEERMNRDLEHIKSSRRNSSDGNHNQSVDDQLNSSERYKSAKKARTSNDEASESSDADQPNKVLRPGDPGFCPRARVPMPSVKDYVVRPKSNVETMEMAEKKVKKSVSRLDKHKRRITEIKRVSKFQRAVNLSVSGKF